MCPILCPKLLKTLSHILESMQTCLIFRILNRDDDGYDYVSTFTIANKKYERRCSLVFAVHCGIFQGANVSVHWKDFVIETALKIFGSLISVLTTERGSRLRQPL